MTKLFSFTGGGPTTPRSLRWPIFYLFIIYTLALWFGGCLR